MKSYEYDEVRQAIAKGKVDSFIFQQEDGEWTMNLTNPNGEVSLVSLPHDCPECDEVMEVDEHGCWCPHCGCGDPMADMMDYGECEDNCDDCPHCGEED